MKTVQFHWTTVVKMALTTLDIYKFIEPFKRSNIFKRVFPSDCLPSKFSLPAAFVINLAEHTSRGTHWVALYIQKNGYAEYFDSLGFPPTEKNIILFIRKHCKLVEHNEKQIQHISSNKCGKFVITFILSKMYGRNILPAFSTNLYVNEIVVENILTYFEGQHRLLLKF